MLIRRLSAVCALIVLGCSAIAGLPETPMPVDVEPARRTPERDAALNAIRADPLKGHVSFLASDLLEGRDSPSKGLDLAAEYIASQFRRAGLEPMGDDGFFQTARWKVTRADPSKFAFTIQVQDHTFQPSPRLVTMRDLGPLDIQASGLYHLGTIKVPENPESPPANLAQVEPEAVAGRAVVLQLPPAIGDLAQRSAASSTLTHVARVLKKARLVILLAPDDPEGSGLLGAHLKDPDSDAPSRAPRNGRIGNCPWISVHDPSLVHTLAELPKGPIDGSVSLILGPPVEEPAILRNVVARLEGSDPALKDEYVVVSAHYDHIGLSSYPAPDVINNGANDDASGTASVVEIAQALSTLNPRPRRSILFVTFFGEEKGLLGSRYFGAHPVVPIEKIVAQINLEQVGRTDDLEGPQINKFSITGFGYSDVSRVLQSAALAQKVEAVHHPTNSDAFFGRSDNQALADLGIPAHTVSVGYIFPDYHGESDHWDRLDYANMARVDRAVALALVELADLDATPRWNASNPRTRPYLNAWKKRHAHDPEP